MAQAPIKTGQSVVYVVNRDEGFAAARIARTARSIDRWVRTDEGKVMRNQVVAVSDNHRASQLVADTMNRLRMEKQRRIAEIDNEARARRVAVEHDIERRCKELLAGFQKEKTA
jgi:hypothetical protein